jgi:hypothetical protein
MYIMGAVEEKNDGQIFEFFLDLDRGRGRDGDEKKNLQKKNFIAIAIATVTSTGTYKNFQKNSSGFSKSLDERISQKAKCCN